MSHVIAWIWISTFYTQ